jgi:hypothetical protein
MAQGDGGQRLNPTRGQQGDYCEGRYEETPETSAESECLIIVIKVDWI